MKRYYGFWLLFDSSTKKNLRPIIQTLSNKFLGGEVFEPHISVNYPSYCELKDIVLKIEENFINQKQFTVNTEGIGMEDTWSKTLYVNIKMQKELININNKLKQIFPRKETPNEQFHPHMSLLYKQGLREKDKVLSIENISIPKRLQITSLAIIDPGIDNDNWKDFTQWKIPYKIDFNHPTT
ncbi:2'-5' RNA ligase family protein [Candidatus Dojkabacteria bacterium]|nr:2'-5' RNA ligase family protein [Candidatus Dojkabacteria bacterium]